MSIKSVTPSNHLILCHPLFLLPIPPSIRVFSNESTLCMRWPKYWTFSFSIIPSKEIPGLISFRMDCLDLLAVQGALKSLLQQHSSKASTLHMRWPKYWSFSFSIIPSKESPGLISFRIDWISLQSKGLSRVFSNTTVQMHQFFGAQPSSQSNSHIHT